MAYVCCIFYVATISRNNQNTICFPTLMNEEAFPNRPYVAQICIVLDELTIRNHMDSISSYLYVLQHKFAEQNNPLRKDMFFHMCRDGLFSYVDEVAKKATE